MTYRWERVKAVAANMGIAHSTLRKWCNEGWVEGRRDGPRLLFVKVYAEGELAGRPVGLEEEGDT